ncbi:MAG: hypothetical protein RIT81_40950 [Deltaproteobacteria bacterium]
MDRHCANCHHIRFGEPANPLEGIRLVSQKVLELRAKWQQELATRATYEEQRMLSGEPFDFEPIAFPYCAHDSERDILDPNSGAKHDLFVLCSAKNPHGNCEDFSDRR